MLERSETSSRVFVVVGMFAMRYGEGSRSMHVSEIRDGSSRVLILHVGAIQVIVKYFLC